jgi:hypothetical protein
VTYIIIVKKQKFMGLVFLPYNTTVLISGGATLSMENLQQPLSHALLSSKTLTRTSLSAEKAPNHHFLLVFDHLLGEL